MMAWLICMSCDENAGEVYVTFVIELIHMAMPHSSSNEGNFMTTRIRHNNLSKSGSQDTIYDDWRIRWRVDQPICDSHSRHYMTTIHDDTTKSSQKVITFCDGFLYFRYKVHFVMVVIWWPSWRWFFVIPFILWQILYFPWHFHFVIKAQIVL